MELNKIKNELTPEQLERIIERAADKAASKAIGRLKAAGRISYHLSDSYKKTEQLLYLYPRLPEGNAERIRIEAAIAVIKDDEYRGVIESRYFDGLTLSEISDIYDCKYQTISKQRIRLVRLLAAELFPEDMAREIARS